MNRLLFNWDHSCSIDDIKFTIYGNLKVAKKVYKRFPLVILKSNKIEYFRFGVF
jgi:hypothetical protein